MNNLYLTTGIPACDAMLDIHLEGNITPPTWYKTIVDTSLKVPKPKLLAICILSDIVYWYRPTPVRDEQSGEIRAYKKKFRGDLLQRSYKQIAEQFGCSTGQAKDAVRFLEELGVIQRVFRDEEIVGTIVSNIMYISLDVNRLRELTYPSGEISTEGGGNFTGGGTEKDPEVTGNISTPLLKNPQYTNTTPQTTASISSETPSPPHECGDGGMDNVLEEKNKLFIHYANLAELNHMKKHGFGSCENDSQCIAVYALIIECLADMSCGRQREYKGSVVSPNEIKSLAQNIVDNEGSLQYFSEDVMWKYIDARKSTQIKNERGYLQSMIWDRLQTYLLGTNDM